MRCEVSGVTDVMLPEPTLPETFLAAFDLRRRALRGCGEVFGEVGFEGMPSFGVVCVALGQGPDRVDRCGQDDNGVDVKGTLVSGVAHRLAQSFDLAHQKVGTAILKARGEKESAAGHVASAIVRHGGDVAPVALL